MRPLPRKPESGLSLIGIAALALAAVVFVALYGIVFGLAPGVCALMAVDCVSDGACDVSIWKGGARIDAHHSGPAGYGQGLSFGALGVLLAYGASHTTASAVSALRERRGRAKKKTVSRQLVVLGAVVYLVADALLVAALVRWME